MCHLPARRHVREGLPLHTLADEHEQPVKRWSSKDKAAVTASLRPIEPTRNKRIVQIVLQPGVEFHRPLLMP